MVGFQYVFIVLVLVLERLTLCFFEHFCEQCNPPTLHSCPPAPLEDEDDEEHEDDFGLIQHPYRRFRRFHDFTRSQELKRNLDIIVK
jgi:hypothetical protein